MLTLMLDGKLFLAPIGSNPQVNLIHETIDRDAKLLKNTQKVLDVGTGTGIWAM